MMKMQSGLFLTTINRCTSKKKNDITAHRINWQEKAENLQSIADSLGLGLDSMVFWDDNPIERNKMKALLPQVFTVDVPEKIIEWPEYIRSLDCFGRLKSTDEDKNKKEQYKAKAEFSSALNVANDVKSYLKSINLSPSVVELNDFNISRAEQLCSKTNQFNISTKRYTSLELQRLQTEKKGFIFLVGLEDTFGDHGLVGLVIVKFLSNNVAFLDTFLLSCRILGRHLRVLDYVRNM